MRATIANMLTGVLMSLAGRIMTAIGLSFVSYAGMNEMQNQLAQIIANKLGGIPNEALQIMYIAGLGVCLNWIFGTFMFIASLKSMKKLSTIVQSK